MALVCEACSLNWQGAFMIYQLAITLFVILCFLMILIILMQKGKSSMGLGGLGGGTQMLFGGSGGQDLFQKVTWALGTIFMVGSLILAMVKKPSSSDLIQGITQSQPAPAVPQVPPVQQ